MLSEIYYLPYGSVLMNDKFDGLIWPVAVIAVTCTAYLSPGNRFSNIYPWLLLDFTSFEQFSGWKTV